MAHTPKYSVILQADSSAAGNVNRAMWASFLARRLDSRGYKVALQITGDPGRIWAEAYGMFPLFLPAGEPPENCEVLFRLFAPGQWPARPGTPPHAPHVIDFAFNPSGASGDADHILALYADTMPATILPRLITDHILAPIPEEVYVIRRDRVLRQIVVFLGTDPNNRTAGLLTALAEQFPKIEGTASSTQDQNITSHAVALPPPSSAPGTIIGELIVVIAGFDGNPTVTWPAGWTQFFGGNNGGAVRLAAAYRVADGTEQERISVTTSAGLRSSHVAYRISGAAAAPTASASATGSSTAPNPASFTPAGGAKSYLWLAAEAHGGNEVPVTVYPSGYVRGVSAANNGGNVAATSRGIKAATEDPGAFTLSSSNAWVAATFAIAPAAIYTSKAVVLPDNSLSGPDISHNPRFWEEMRTADVVVCSPGAPHQVAGALGVPAVIVSNTAQEDARMVSAAETGQEHLFYLGLITSLTDEFIRDQVHEVLLPVPAADAMRRVMGVAGRVVVSSDRSRAISSWLSRYFIGAGRNDPFNVQGFSTVLPDEMPPDRVPFPASIAGIRAYWRLDEASGARLNVISGSVFGDLAETGTVGQEPMGVKYQAATVVATGPGSNYLESDAELLLTSTRTVALWFRVSAVGGFSVIFLSAAGSSDPFELKLLSSGRFNLSVAGGADDTGAAVISASTFYHLVVDYDAATGDSRLFVDGALDVTIPGVSHADATLRALRFGAQGTGGATFTFDEAGVWDRLLTDQERADLLTKFYPFMQA
jgi:hypothetical protein